MATSMLERPSPSRLALVVTRGPDEGARLDVDQHPRVIGRARDADLVLSDLAVSRRHLDVALIEGGVRVRALPETAPFVFAGQPSRDAVLPVGAALTVGGSVMCVMAVSTPERPSMRVERTEARTLLQGAAVEVKGLAATAALMAWLDEATSRAEVQEVLDRWGRLHADATAVTLDLEDDVKDAPACDEHRRAPDDVVVREVDASAAITVPAHAHGRGWITFRIDRPASAVGESHKRLLLVAGRVCGSCLTRLHTLGVVVAQLRDVRQAAIGSARTFLGTSPAAEKLAVMIPKVARSDAAVLLEGETGAGKTFVARLIHESSARAGEPLRVINCATIPEALLESELFGHEKGAFTGATSARAGAFEAVGRGTLFLDEIGELPVASQAKLLRALEERTFERLGSNRPLDLKARVLCATNQDLSAMVRDGRFRSDLLFRVSVITLRVPPLRERGDDLVLLAKQILDDLAPTAGRRVDGFTDRAIAVIRRYPWPGNVRELRNAIEHALVLGADRLIAPEDLPETLGALAMSAYELPPSARDGREVVSLPAPLDEVERLAIQAALRATGGNRTKAAALLGINRTTLYAKLQREGGTQGT